MNIKKATTILMATMAFAVFAKGVYFVSGGDFRKCDLKYIMQTTEANQSIQITPAKAKTLASFSGDGKYDHKWSFKSEGSEYEYDFLVNIGLNDFGGRGGTVAEPTYKEYANPGSHMVKMYNEGGNVFRVWFDNDPNLTELYVNWTDFAPITGGTTRQGPSVSVKRCKNLRKFVYNNPRDIPNTRSRIENYDFCDLPNCSEFTFGYPEYYKEVGDYAFSSNGMHTINLPAVTNIVGHAFQYSSATNAILTDLEVAGSWCFMAAFYLKTLRISEKVRSVGSNAMYNTFKRVRTESGWTVVDGGTIEFVTSADDFVAAWNNHPILPNWFGPAVAIEGNDNEATLIPFTGHKTSGTERPAPYFTANNFPKPDRLVRIRPEDN